ncbi:MAG: class I SAM-dependent methyltransferase [Polyangiaceae bacterium]
MREDAPSFTAAIVAAMRGLGAFLPARLRLVDDPYGLRFAGRLKGLRERRPLERGLRLTSRAWMRGRLRNFIVYMQLRTRVIDDDVAAFVASGGRQLVLLGAGFDTRAWRLGALADVAVFEVDHPATQAKKRTLMQKDTPQGSVAFVPWDFERDPLDQLHARLGLDGHDARAPTMTILEGVLPYLTEETAASTFGGIARYSAPGSPLAFTYSEKALIEAKASSNQRKVLRLLGEPFRFGFDPSSLSEWLEDRGFALERDESALAIAARLLGTDGSRLTDGDPAGRHFALARRRR